MPDQQDHFFCELRQQPSVESEQQEAPHQELMCPGGGSAAGRDRAYYLFRQSFSLIAETTSGQKSGP